MGKVFVIACHAIETPKLLLLSAGEGVPDGVANSSGQVGRNLLSQIDVGIQGLTAEPVFPYRGPVSTGGILELRDGPFRGEHCVARHVALQRGLVAAPSGRSASPPSSSSRDSAATNSKRDPPQRLAPDDHRHLGRDAARRL